jgi:predicted AAA+ superfamily ATPase
VYERALRSTLAQGRHSVLLLGPRQVGKTTLLRSLQPDVVVDLADLGALRRYQQRPEILGEELAALPAKTRLTVLVDEVQRVPAILDVVQAWIDREKGRIRFLLTGSSARKLRRGQANLLPGRVHLHYLHPLLAAEIGAEFDLGRALAHGTLPGVYAERDPAARARTLESYTNLYLREEVQAESLVRDLGGYGRLLDVVAARSGSILNLRALCKDAEIPYETARRYLEVLEDTLIVFRVPAWSGADVRSLVGHPRVFVFDSGVRNALLRRPLDRPLDDERGLLLEHFIAAEIRRRVENAWYGAKLYHFRDRGGAEVDFVLEVGRELWAIEVKSGSDVRDLPRRGFEALAARSKHVKRRIVVFLGSRARRVDDIEILPLASFLAELPVRAD